MVALCLAAAAWVVVGELRPAPPATTPVLVTSRTLPAGSVITADDVRVQQLTSAPEGTVSAAAAVGSTVTIGIPAGLPVVSTMLLGPGLAQAAPPGWVVTPVQLADPVLAELLRVGDRVDLYLAAGDTGGRIEAAQLITQDALVLARDGPAAAPSSWLSGSSAAQESVVVLALRPEDAAALAGASGFGPFRAVLAGA